MKNNLYKFDVPKIGIFEIVGEIFLYPCGDLYVAKDYMTDEKLFFISSDFARELLNKRILYGLDGALPTGNDYCYIVWKEFREFLNQRKIIYKNCYYDIAYKKKS